jgi:hypothetical protein
VCATLPVIRDRPSGSNAGTTFRPMELVFLHGRAASGKLTVARALSDRLHFPVFHNHLVVDLLTGVFPFGSEPFVRLREQFWLSVFVDAAVADTSLIFTFAPDATVRPGFPTRAREALESSSGRVCFVRLLVDDSEQERRITLPSRGEFHKLSDLETLRRLRARVESPEQPPVDLSIDTEQLTVDDAVETIIDHFDLQARQPVERFPLDS